jgi:hypothetical protein
VNFVQLPRPSIGGSIGLRWRHCSTDSHLKEARVSNHSIANLQKGPAGIEQILQRLKRQLEDALFVATSSVEKKTLTTKLKTVDVSIRKLKQRKRYAPSVLHEIDHITDRARVMSRLARKVSLGKSALYHGTRRLPCVLRTGKLIPPLEGEAGVFFSRSPETAAYFATILGFEEEQLSPGILILDRDSLARTYRIDSNRYDESSDRDEREEVVWGRIINFRRHLLGVVKNADVIAKLGPPKHDHLPEDFLTWSQEQRSNFDQEAWIAGDKLVAKGREKVRRAIIAERRTPGARSPISRPPTARREPHQKRTRPRTGPRRT